MRNIDNISIKHQNILLIYNKKKYQKTESVSEISRRWLKHIKS